MAASIGLSLVMAVSSGRGVAESKGLAAQICLPVFSSPQSMSGPEVPSSGHRTQTTVSSSIVPWRYHTAIMLSFYLYRCRRFHPWWFFASSTGVSSRLVSPRLKIDSFRFVSFRSLDGIRGDSKRGVGLA